MGKGNKTRQEIVQKVAVLFNERGYAATSMRDITVATGLQRGGIYNHFSSKDELAVETFEYACSILGKQLIQKVKGQQTALEQLKAIATAFAELYTQNPLFPCGCQVLNTAVEAKRHMITLRQKAQEAMDTLNALIVKKTRQAVEQGQLPDSTDADAVAAIYISTLEGAMLLSVLYDNGVYLDHAVNHLHWYLDRLSAASHSCKPLFPEQ